MKGDKYIILILLFFQYAVLWSITWELQRRSRVMEPTQTTNNLDQIKLAKLLFIYLINMNVISDSGSLKMCSTFVIRADITLDITP